MPDIAEDGPGRSIASTPLHVGWRELHPDASLNFQLNRWAAYGGPRWVADVVPAVERLVGYEPWRETFIELGERATSQGRTLHAALHFRAAEFFMVGEDARKEPLRRRLLAMFREAAGVPLSARRDVRFDGLTLPAYHLPAPPGAPARGTLVVFGGFDSYIEEFFPILGVLEGNGWNVIAFEGPGQGSVLEEQHAPMTPEWHRPVGAILDAFGLDDVTLLGISLGGCLVVRAAAFEPRVRRVVAFDAMTDFLACLLRQSPPLLGAVVRALLAARGGAIFDRLAPSIAKRRPVVEWGLAEAKSVMGRPRPSEALEAARAFRTHDISHLVTQDVLLLAGTRDHYVPLSQLWEQARLLTNARSLTLRAFTESELGHAHCQVGNLPRAIEVISSWIHQTSEYGP